MTAVLLGLQVRIVHCLRCRAETLDETRTKGKVQ